MRKQRVRQQLRIERVEETFGLSHMSDRTLHFIPSKNIPYHSKMLELVNIFFEIRKGKLWL